MFQPNNIMLILQHLGSLANFGKLSRLDLIGIGNKQEILLCRLDRKVKKNIGEENRDKQLPYCCPEKCICMSMKLPGFKPNLKKNFPYCSLFVF